MEIAKITSKGQVTIPNEIRKKLGVDTGDKLAFIEDNGMVVVVKADDYERRARLNSYIELLRKSEK